MKTLNNQQLSSELQELYLQNKQWYSDVLFLEDEAAFFQKLFGSVLSSVIKENLVSEVLFINASMKDLEARRNEQKNLILKNQHLLEGMLKDEKGKIDLSFITEHEKIVEEIKSLFISEKLVKKELYTLVEQVMLKNKEGHLLTN